MRGEKIMNQNIKVKNDREENQDWERANLFEVPNRDKIMEYLKKRENEARLRVQEDTIRKRQLDIERRLEEFDRDINLRRVLRSDRRYLSIGRDRTRPKFFDSITMAKISRDVAKIRARSSTTNKQSKPSMDPNFYQNQNSTCSKFWYEENGRRGSWESGIGEGNNSGMTARTTKLPEIIGFKKSENSDCLNQHLEMQQYVPSHENKSNRYDRSKRIDYSVINTRISIIRPKY